MTHVACLKLPNRNGLPLPIVWLGQSVRTTVVTRRYPQLAKESWMVSLGDAVHRPRLIDTVFRADIRTRIAVNGPLMLDSGGFTMMTSDRSLSVEQVAGIYRDAQAELCVTLDVPPLELDDCRKRRRKYRQTLTNLAALVDAVGPRRIVPVVHGVTVDEVTNNCRAISSLLRKPTMICLGGLVPLLRRSIQHSVDGQRSMEWLRMLVRASKAAFPRAVIHILGAGSPKNIGSAIACGADSTDSLAWRRAAGFGTIYLPGTSERFLLPRNRQRENSRLTVNADELQLLEACRCPACIEWPDLKRRIKGLANSYLARAAHNASVVLSEARRAAAVA